MATVRAKYEKGVLTPLEPLDLEEGREIVLSFEEATRPVAETHVGDSDNVGESILEMFERLRKSVPPEAWDGLPTDGAKNYKHYLYGHPKVDD